MRARLIHYAPNLRQALHRHEGMQASFLLLGSLHEQSGRREAMPRSRSLAIRPAETSHEVAFGPNGALILSIDVKGNEPVFDAAPCAWRRPHQIAGRTLRTALQASDDETAGAALWDLLALAPHAGPHSERPRKRPNWLEQVLEHLQDDPASFKIGDVARRVGVHRVHLSRRFTDAYGLPPSLFRLRCMAARALTAVICNGLSIADAALSAGFADQSHFTRVVAREASILPGNLRRSLARLHSFKTPGRTDA
jgi:AraC family transcriptional regulator